MKPTDTEIRQLEARLRRIPLPELLGQIRLNT